MLQVHYPPIGVYEDPARMKIFLAGTIDMGLSTDWQKIIIEFLTAQFGTMPLDIFNPRRKDWDNSWEQSPNHPMFKRQVDWELIYQEKADVVLMVLLEGSQSPVSLLELGNLKGKNLLVYVPEKFYRFGNVEIFCRRNKIASFHDWDDYLIAVRRFVDAHLLKYVTHG